MLPSLPIPAHQFDECIVDAESQAELASCMDGPPVSTPYFTNPFEGAMQWFMKKAQVDVDAEECIVDAESLEEIVDCKN